MIQIRHCWQFVASAVLALVLMTRAASAQTHGRVGFSPPSSNVSAGQTFSLALVGRSFDRVTEGGGVNLQFNPARLRVTNVSVDGVTWEFFAQAGAIDNTLGRVNGLLFASFIGRTGDFPIATIGFQALSAGSVSVQLSEASQNPFASGGQLLPVTFETASVAIVGGAIPAPLPPVAGIALGLLLGGAGIVLLRRRQVALLSESGIQGG